MPQIDITLDPDALRAFTAQYRDIAARWQAVSNQLAQIHEALVQETSTYTVGNAPAPMLRPLVDSFTQKIERIDASAAAFYAVAFQDADTLDALAKALEELSHSASAAIDNT